MPLTEKAIQRGIRDYLGSLGYRTYHTWLSKNSDPGFPDLFAVNGKGHLIVIECKGKNGRVSIEQEDWLTCFSVVDGCLLAAVVGPTDTLDWMGYDTALRRIKEVTDAATGGQDG